MANVFIEKYQLHKKRYELTSDDYNSIINIACVKYPEFNKILLGVETFYWKKDNVQRIHFSSVTFAFEAISAVETPNDGKIKSINGIFRILDHVIDKNGTCLKINEKIENVVVIRNDDFKAWINKLGTDNDDLFMKVVPCPIMGYYFYDLF